MVYILTFCAVVVTLLVCQSFRLDRLPASRVNGKMQMMSAQKSSREAQFHCSRLRMSVTTEKEQQLEKMQVYGNLPPRNLKTAPGHILPDNTILSSWNEMKGLSEKDLLTRSTGDRTKTALDLAYNRCEYVTKLFSKTFYMGTSLMRPNARRHVWAIYAWCRRSDDLVDSPR